MNKKLFSSVLLAIVLVAGTTHATETSQTAKSESPVCAAPAEVQELKPEQLSQLSEAFGHMLAQHIQSLGVNFDVTQLVKGLQDAHQGKASPMDEMKCIETLTQARQQAFQRLAKKNLSEAESYLQLAAKKEGIQALEEGRLYFQIDRKGEGDSVIAGNTPLIRYKGSFMDGTIFGSSKEDDLVSLDETIPGFSRGLLGMKEGEKRTLYIHPDLAYGTSGQLPPNSLLVFEIELLKAHASQGNADSISSTDSPSTADKEISQNEVPPSPAGESPKTIR